MTKISKILSSVLAASMLVSAFAMNAFAAATQHTVTLATESNTTGLAAGDTVVVTVKIDNTANICGFGYALLYDTKAFEVDATKGWMSMKDYQMHENFADQTWYDTFKADPMGSILSTSALGLYKEGEIRFTASGAMGIPSGIAANDYLIGKFTFTVKEGAANGDYKFMLDGIKANSFTTDDGQTTEVMLNNVLTVTVGEPQGPQEPEPTYDGEEFFAVSLQYGKTGQDSGVVEFKFKETSKEDDSLLGYKGTKIKLADAGIDFEGKDGAIMSIGLKVENILSTVNLSLDSAKWVTE